MKKDDDFKRSDFESLDTKRKNKDAYKSNFEI